MFVRYARLTQEAAHNARSVAVLPLAAIESHGPHLPLGTDQLIVDGLLDAAEKLVTGPESYVRLPTLWLGASAEHADHKGTLSQEPEMLIAEIAQIAAGLAKSGIHRIVLFSGHGGNVAAGQLAALRLRTKFEMLAASMHWLDLGLPPALTPPTPANFDVHGGWIETSLMLHLAPDLVVRGAAAPRPAVPLAPLLFPHGPVAWGWKTDDLAAQGGDGGWIGNPERAHPDLGAQMIAHTARALVGFLKGFAAAPWPRR